MTPFSFRLSQAHPIAHTIALAISAIGTAMGFYILQSPAKFATGWGLAHEASSPLWLALGGRNISPGILLTTFSLQGKLREFGLCLMCFTAAASIDTYVTLRNGEADKAWVSSLAEMRY